MRPHVSMRSADAPCACRSDGLVAPEALLLVGMTLLDLPRAVAHVMVRRVQAKMTPPAAAEGGVSWAVFEACHAGLTLTRTLTRTRTRTRTLSLSLTQSLTRFGSERRRW